MKKILSLLFALSFGTCFMLSSFFIPLQANGYEEAQQHINQIQQEQQNIQSFNTIMKYAVFALLGIGIVSFAFSSKKHNRSSQNNYLFQEQQRLFDEQNRQNEQIFRENNQQFHDQLNRDTYNTASHAMNDAHNATNHDFNNHFHQM